MTGSKTLLAGAVLAGLLLAPMAARADYEGWIKAEFDYVGPYKGVYISTFTFPVCAGVYHWNQTVPGNAQFWTFCIEPTRLLSQEETRFDLWHLDQAPTISPTVAGYIEELWYEKISEPSTPLFNPYGSSETDKVNAAAFQLAVWEFVQENPSNGYNISSGGFKMYNSPSLASKAQQWINETVLDGDPEGNITLTAMISAESQDHALFRGDLQVVPLPAAVWGGMVLLGGMGGFAAVRRRLRRG